MKKIYFEKTKVSLKVLLLALGIFSLGINAQCLNADVILNTQAQLNSWAANFPNCTRIAYTLRIGAPNNGAPSDITDVSPLAMVTEISGSLIVQNNGLLESLNGLKVAKIGGRLTIGGEFEDISNVKLKNLEGLNQVKSIGQFLMIRNNPVLKNLNELSNLTSITQDIEISGNTILSDISGLKNTTFNAVWGWGLSITSNPALAVCNMPNFCGYLANPNDTHPRTISYNLANCLDEEAVSGACASLAVTDIEKSNITIYPNPVKSMLSFSEEVSEITISDLSGKMVKQNQALSKSVNVSTLTAGAYIITAKTKSGKKITKKLIKE